MKVRRLSDIVFGLMVLITSNALAANVAHMNIFLDNENCQGDANIVMPVGVENQCIFFGAGSVKPTCSQVQSFQSNDCTGPSETSSEPFQCTAGDGSSSIAKCESIPDNRIAKVQAGESCSESGEMENTFFEGILVVDTCRVFQVDDLATSFKLIVTDTGLNVTVFTEKSDCTGASVGLPIETGSCQLADGTVFGLAAFGRRRLAEEFEQIAIKITPAVEGANLGSNAMVNSVGILTLLVSMIGALATIL